MPKQDGALPDRAVPQLDEESAHAATAELIRTRLGTTSSRCPEWKAQQKILWVEVKKETRRWKDRWKIRDLLADERCS